MNIERKLETLTGLEKAKARIASYVRDFNEGNEREGSDVMSANKSGLRAEDGAGSGEFIEARCINSNEAENAEAEVFEIFVLA